MMTNNLGQMLANSLARVLIMLYVIFAHLTMPVLNLWGLKYYYVNADPWPYNRLWRTFWKEDFLD